MRISTRFCPRNSPRRFTTCDATQSAGIAPRTPVGVSFQLVWRRGGLTISASNAPDSRAAARERAPRRPASRRHTARSRRAAPPRTTTRCRRWRRRSPERLAGTQRAASARGADSPRRSARCAPTSTVPIEERQVAAQAFRISRSSRPHSRPDPRRGPIGTTPGRPRPPAGAPRAGSIGRETLLEIGRRVPVAMEARIHPAAGHRERRRHVRAKTPRAAKRPARPVPLALSVDGENRAASVEGAVSAWPKRT